MASVSRRPHHAGGARVEGVLASRLRLLEFSFAHSVEEVLQFALDELEGLTGSRIGFLHFLAPDQKTISLRAWSTGTVRTFCSASVKERHYDIGEAGVWVDCVRERRPVIHNDYAALPHRKGLPKGHAPVVRELVVPVFRKRKIVAILGVGNKPSPYDRNDVDTVVLLADLAWDICERKRAEENLFKAEQELRTVLNNAPMTIFTTDTNGVFTLSEGKGLQKVGLKPGQNVGVSALELYRSLPVVEEGGAVTTGADVIRRVLGGETLKGYTELRGVRFENHFVPLRGSDGRIAGLLGIAADVTERSRVDEKRRTYQRHLQVLASRLAIAEERERRRIAEILHDDVGQTLALAAMKLSAIERRAIPAREDRSIAEVQELLRGAIKKTRSLTADLHPPALGQLGLHRAIARLCEQFGGEHEIECRFVRGRGRPDLDDDAAAFVYRAVRELIVNAAKHSGARTVLVSLDATGPAVKVRVRDDGRGMSEKARSMKSAPKGFGLFSIRERLAHLGGRLDIESEPGKGSSIAITLPARRPDRNEKGERHVRKNSHRR